MKLHFYAANNSLDYLIFEEDPEITLRYILTKFIQTNNLAIKNIDFYSFLEHSNKSRIDEEINLDTQLKYLNTNELDVKFIKLVIFKEIPRSTRKR